MAEEKRDSRFPNWTRLYLSDQYVSFEFREGALRHHLRLKNGALVTPSVSSFPFVYMSMDSAVRSPRKRGERDEPHQLQKVLRLISCVSPEVVTGKEKWREGSRDSPFASPALSQTAPSPPPCSRS